jgi:hypothetical protein
MRGAVARVGSVIAGALLSGALGACGDPGTGALSNGDIPSNLGMQANSSSFGVIAGSTRVGATVRFGPGQTCPSAYRAAFLPPGKAPDAADGVGQPITLPELLVLVWKCPSPSVAHMVLAVVTTARQRVPGVADEAVILDSTDDAQDGYPKSRVFIVGWRRGRTVGTLELAGADGDSRITAVTAELIARRAAAQSG